VQYRSLKKITEPTTEPVSVAEAKAHCRIDTSDDDTYFSTLITAAREFCESYCDMTFAVAQYRLRLDAFPIEIELPRPPMASTGTATAVSVTYSVTTASTVALTASEFTVDRESIPGEIRPVAAWPAVISFGPYPATSGGYPGAVEVTWWGGNSTASAKLKNAILWLVGLWYERRMAADQASLAEMPFGVKAMLDSLKWRAR
jgi:uncharacterized phiE125 gp8 family phage protein